LELEIYEPFLLQLQVGLVYRFNSFVGKVLLTLNDLLSEYFLLKLEATTSIFF